MTDQVEIERQKIRDRLKQPPAPQDHHEHNGHAQANGKPKHRKPASIGRFQTMNAFIDQSARLVDTTAQAVWFVLFRETRSNGVATVAHSQIAQMIGVSRRTVVRAIDALQSAGLVETVVQGGHANGRMPSTYRAFGLPQTTKNGDASVTAKPKDR